MLLRVHAFILILLKNRNCQPANLIDEIATNKTLYSSSEPKRTLRSDNTPFRTIMKRDGAISGRRINTAAGIEDPIAWASKLNKMAFDDKHVGISEDQRRRTFTG